MEEPFLHLIGHVDTYEICILSCVSNQKREEGTIINTLTLFISMICC